MPTGPKQSPGADINIEYQANSGMAGDSAKLASLLQAAKKEFARDYPAKSSRNRQGSNPNHHEPTDLHAIYAEEEFRFGK